MNDLEKSPRRLKKRLSWLVGIGGLAIIAGMITMKSPRWLFQPVGEDRGSREAMLRVEPARRPLFGSRQSDQVEGTGDAYLQTQMELLKSKRIFDATLTDPAVSELPIVRRQTDLFDWLQGAIQVEAIKGTFLIRVAMEDGNPDEAYEILRAVIRSYMEQHKEYGRSSNTVLIKSLQEESVKLEHEISRARNELNDIAQSSGPDMADPGHRGEYRQYLRQELVRTKLNIEAAKVRIRSVEPQKGQDAAKGEVIPPHPLKVLEGQLKLLEEELSRADAELSKAEEGEMKSLLLTRKIENLTTLHLSVGNQLRETVWQAGTENTRVSIADPPRPTLKKRWEKESGKGKPD